MAALAGVVVLLTGMLSPYMPSTADAIRETLALEPDRVYITDGLVDLASTPHLIIPGGFVCMVCVRGVVCVRGGCCTCIKSICACTYIPMQGTQTNTQSNTHSLSHTLTHTPYTGHILSPVPCKQLFFKHHLDESVVADLRARFSGNQAADAAAAAGAGSGKNEKGSGKNGKGSGKGVAGEKEGKKDGKKDGKKEGKKEGKKDGRNDDGKQKGNGEAGNNADGGVGEKSIAKKKEKAKVWMVQDDCSLGLCMCNTLIHTDIRITNSCKLYRTNKASHACTYVHTNTPTHTYTHTHTYTQMHTNTGTTSSSRCVSSSGCE